jgi:hypothetical protein
MGANKPARNTHQLIAKVLVWVLNFFWSWKSVNLPKKDRGWEI